MIGFGNIQPALLRRNDGTIVAYMRENGPQKRIHVCESKDDGMTWGRVGKIDLPNPGSGLDAVRLRSGNWILIYNDSESGRNQLAVSFSNDEGQSWQVTKYLERHPEGSYHYPAVIQTRDGKIHAVYSHSTKAGESIKHVQFDEASLLN